MDIGWRNVAVAMVSLTSAREMLLWLRFRGHRLEKCCCGIGFVDIGWGNVAVANVSFASAGEMLLWLRFGGHRLQTCSCG